MNPITRGLRWLLGDIRGRAFFVVLGAFVCQFGLAFGYTSSPVLTQLTGELGWTRTQFSTFGDGWRVWVTALGHPLFGWLTLRFGGRPVLIGSVASIALGSWGLAQMSTLWELVVWQTVLGLMQVGVSDMVAGQVVAEWVKARRGLALGVVYAGANVGAAILVNVMAQITANLTWRQAYLYTGLAGSLLILPFAAFGVRAPRPGEGAPDARRGPVHEAAAGDLDLATALRTRSFWALALGLFSFFFYFVGVVSHFVPYLQDQGMDVRTAAGYYGIAVLMGFVAKPVYGLVADVLSARMPARVGLLGNTALLTASACLALALPNRALLWVWIVVYGVSATARDVVYPMMLIESFGVRHMAPIYGALMLALGAGPLGTIAAAHIRDRTGSYDGAFALFAGLNLVAFLCLFLVRKETPDRTPAAHGR